MRILALLAGLLFFASCQNADQYQAPVKELISNWEATTQNITQLRDQIESEMVTWKSSNKEEQVEEAILAKLSDEQKEQLSELGTERKGHADSFKSLRTEVNTYLEKWEEQEEVLTTIQDELADGTVREAIDANLGSIKALLSKSTDKIDQWNAEFDAIAKNCQDTDQRFADLFTSFQDTE